MSRRIAGRRRGEVRDVIGQPRPLLAVARRRGEDHAARRLVDHVAGRLPHARVVQAGLAAVAQAAAEPGHSTGLFWHDRAPRPTHRLRRGDETPQARAALWALCVDATRS